MPGLQPKNTESSKSKVIGYVVLTVALLVVSIFFLSLAREPSAVSKDIDIRAEVLALVGTLSGRAPESLLLQEGNRVVAIGDSITAGGGYLRYIDSVLAELYPALKIPRVINAGIRGEKAEDLVERFQQDVLDRHPAVVTINIGINDVWHRLGAPPDQKVLRAYRENIARMVEMARANGIKVILLTPTLIHEDPGYEGNQRLVQYVEAMKTVSLEKHCGLADLHAMFLEALRHKPAAVEGNWLTSDGVHMSPVGDGIIAVGVLRALGVPEEDLAELK